MKKYTSIAMLLHWLIALLIIAAFCLGVTMVDMRGFSSTKLQYFSWHKWVGVTVFGSTCLRLLWRLANTPPPYPSTMPSWQKSAATGLHVSLYVLTFCIPISGYLYSLAAGSPVVYLGIVPLPVIMDPNPDLKPLLKEAHYILNMILLVSISIHVLAALKHQFVDRDSVINRMTP